MSAAQAALGGLVSALSAAVDRAVALEPAGPSVVSGNQATMGPPPTPDQAPDVAVRAVALTRLGRSTRAGQVLDLELRARVLASGEDALATTETLLVALERDGRYQVEPLPGAGAPGTGGSGPRLGFDVLIRVPVRLDEPTAPAVLEPLRVDLRPSRAMTGLVVDGEGGGVPDAVVRAAVGGRPVVADAEGRFRILVADAPSQEFVVEVRGTTRTIEAATQTAPVVIRWPAVIRWE